MKETEHNEWDELKKIPLKYEMFSRMAETEDLLKVKYSYLRRKEKAVYLISRAAAAVLIIGLVGSSAYFASNKRIETTHYAEEVFLPDGSGITIYPESELRYNRLSWFFTRTTFLEGAARFVVRKGSTFTVETRSAQIEVLGTIFRVEERGDELQVQCEEGHVRVITSTENRELHAGEIFELAVNPKKIPVSSKIENEPDSARNELFRDYDEISLKELCKEISTLYDIQLSVDDSLMEHSFSGVIPTDNLDQALEVITATFDLRIRKKKDHIYLTK